MTIFKRFVFTYLTIAMLIAFIEVYIYTELEQLNRLVNCMVNQNTKTISLIDDLKDAMLSQQGFERKYIISKDEDFLVHFEKIKQRIINNIKELEKKDVANMPTEVKRRYNEYLDAFFNESTLLTKNYNQQDYQKYRKMQISTIDKINSTLNEISTKARSSIEEKIKQITSIKDQLYRIIGVTLIIVVIIGILLSLIITRSIKEPISSLQAKTKEIAAGEFNKVLYIDSPPEIKELADAFNNMCDRLRELNDMKVDVISHISHQFRTPLTVIKESSNMLIENVFVDTPEKQYELSLIINRECERLINAVNGVLDLSSMEAKMMNYEFKPLSMSVKIKKIASQLAPVAQKKKIRLKIDLPVKPLLAKMDEDRIDQVLENLLHNALKFTRKGGKITIKAIKVDKMIMVSYKDTGCGVPPQKLTIIFDKFKRIDSGMGTQRGTGLGLAIAKHIVKAHGGEIWATSKLHSGSTFTFTLPAA